MKKENARRRDSLYHIWKEMKARCLCITNSRYKNYGGRGIKIYEPWLDFDIFKEWAINNGFKYSNIKNTGESLSLDRIQVNGGYFPENCRWVSKRDNARYKTSELDNEISELLVINTMYSIHMGNDFV